MHRTIDDKLYLEFHNGGGCREVYLSYSSNVTVEKDESCGELVTINNVYKFTHPSEIKMNITNGMASSSFEINNIVIKRQLSPKRASICVFFNHGDVPLHFESHQSLMLHSDQTILTTLNLSMRKQ